MKTTRIINLLSLSLLCLTSCSDPVKNCEHSYKFVGAIASTCLEEGLKTHYECQKCGAFFSAGTRELVNKKDLVTPPLGHTFIDNKILVEPTCKTDGLTLQKCVRCDVTQEVAVPKYDTHVFNKQVMEEKYLKTPGDCYTKDIYYCSCGCGESSASYTGQTFEGNERHNLTKHEAKESTPTVPGNAEYYTCDLCEGIFTFDANGKIHKEDRIPIYQGAIKLNLLDGATLDIVDKTVEEYLNVVDDPTTESNEIAEYIYNHAGRTGGCSVNKDINISWTTTSEAKAPFTLSLYKDEALTQLAESYSTNNKFVQIKNLIPGKYYYRVTDSATTTNYSLIDSFKFNSTVRAIDNINNIRNMRDLGGWKCEGGTVKYGMLFRTATWENCGTYGNEVLDSLGVKSELDIRFNDSSKGRYYDESANPNVNIQFYHMGLTDSYSSMVTHADTIANIGSIFTLLSRDYAYPLAYHCSAGSDRTGFLSVLIEGLLGVSNEDIYHDYELTTWYYSKRLRGDVRFENGIYKFDPTGNCDQGSWTSNLMYLINGLVGGYGDGTGSISNAVRKFLKVKVNLSDETLNKVKAKLIETE